MDLFASTIDWHPKFRRFQVESDSLYLIGENESFLLDGKSHQVLIDQVDGSNKVSEIVYSNPDFMAQAITASIIQELLNKSILVTDFPQSFSSNYNNPDFQDKPIPISCRNGMEVWSLSGSDKLNGLVAALSQINSNEISSIVIADDYLDPRLERINRTYLEQNRCWLILKPTGEKISVGPVFNPVKCGLCWRCLSSVLIQNQPLRKWICQRLNIPYIAVPALYDTVTMPDIHDRIISTITNLEREKKYDTIRELSNDGYSFIDHFVRKRPQCPHCGNPQEIEQAIRQPLILNSCLKKYSADGGARSKTPIETVKDLENLVNPITGVAFGLNKLGKYKGIETYRTLFYKTPLGITRPENDDFVQVSLGKGISSEQSKASAICESIERYTAQYQGEEPVVVSKPKDLDYRYVLPGELAIYSERQYSVFEKELKINRTAKKYYAEQYHPDFALPWTLAWSLSSDEFCYIPFTYCFTNTPFDEERFCRFNSNGNAAGNTLEEAILQGFLELVERDATAIWWYNRIPRPSVSLSTISSEIIELVNQTLEDIWEYWMLDITHDFEIPVIAAIGKNRQSGKIRFGFGCHLDISLACQRALTELCQLVAIEHSRSSSFDFDEIVQDPFLFPERNPKDQRSSVNQKVNPDIKDDIQACLKTTDRLGLETLVVQTTRPDIPLSTVKVIIPGLCHVWPQLGNKRLYNVPYQLNWISKAATEADLNPMSLLV